MANCIVRHMPMWSGNKPHHGVMPINQMWWWWPSAILNSANDNLAERCGKESTFEINDNLTQNENKIRNCKLHHFLDFLASVRGLFPHTQPLEALQEWVAQLQAELSAAGHWDWHVAGPCSVSKWKKWQKTLQHYCNIHRIFNSLSSSLY